jgi:Uma2 family endonuclease
VSDSTLRKDRVIKAHIYAQAGLADYWIVNIQDRQLEIHRKPGPDPDRKGRFRYHEITTVDHEGHASPLAAPDARVAVADLLP